MAVEMMELVRVDVAGGIPAIGKQIKMTVREAAAARFPWRDVILVDKLLVQIAQAYPGSKNNVSYYGRLNNGES